MTQDRHTLAEQIGTLRFLIAREGKSDYIGPTIVDRLRGILTTLEGMAAPGDGMRLWLWKNGDHYLAYEHEYPCYPDGGDPLTLGEPIGYAIFKQSAPPYAPGDSPSPQQPTQEALSEALDYLDFPEVPWDKIKDALLPETRNQIIALATLLDRFAAQRVTDLEAKLQDERRHNARQSLDASTAAFNARVWMNERFEKWASNPAAWTNDDDIHMEFRNVRHIAERLAAQRVTAAIPSGAQLESAAVIHNRIRSSGQSIHILAAALTAATDKARRDIVADLRNPNGEIYQQSLKLGVHATLLDIADWIEGTPQNPVIKCAVYSQVPPYRMRCEKCLAAGRCLESEPPQNPGDTAPRQEGEE